MALQKGICLNHWERQTGEVRFLQIKGGADYGIQGMQKVDAALRQAEAGQNLYNSFRREKKHEVRFYISDRQNRERIPSHGKTFRCRIAEIVRGFDRIPMWVADMNFRQRRQFAKRSRSVWSIRCSDILIRPRTITTASSIGRRSATWR